MEKRRALRDVPGEGEEGEKPQNRDAPSPQHWGD